MANPAWRHALFGILVSRIVAGLNDGARAAVAEPSRRAVLRREWSDQAFSHVKVQATFGSLTQQRFNGTRHGSGSRGQRHSRASGRNGGGGASVVDAVAVSAAGKTASTESTNANASAADNDTRFASGKSIADAAGVAGREAIAISAQNARVEADAGVAAAIKDTSLPQTLEATDDPEWLCHKYDESSQNDMWCQGKPSDKQYLYEFFVDPAICGCGCCKKKKPVSWKYILGPVSNEESRVECPADMRLVSCGCSTGAQGKCWNYFGIDNACVSLLAPVVSNRTTQAVAICASMAGTAGWELVLSPPTPDGKKALVKCPAGKVITGCMCKVLGKLRCAGTMIRKNVCHAASAKSLQAGVEFTEEDVVHAQALCGNVPGSRSWQDVFGAPKYKSTARCPEGSMLTGCSCMSYTNHECKGIKIYDNVTCSVWGIRSSGVVQPAVAAARCGVVPKFQPSATPVCVYEKCSLLQVEGANSTFLNGIYRPVHRRCESGDGNYGGGKFGSYWRGYQNKEGVSFSWRWNGDAGSGWGLEYQGQVLYSDWLKRLSPTALVLDSLRAVPPVASENVPIVKCFQKVNDVNVEEIRDPTTMKTKEFTDGWSDIRWTWAADGRIHGPFDSGPAITKTFLNLPPHDIVAISLRFWSAGPWAPVMRAQLAVDEEVPWIKGRKDASTCSGWSEFDKEDLLIEPVRLGLPGRGKSKEVYQQIDLTMTSADKLWCFTDVVAGLQHTGPNITVSLATGQMLASGNAVAAREVSPAESAAGTASSSPGAAAAAIEGASVAAAIAAKAKNAALGGRFGFTRLTISVGSLRYGVAALADDVRNFTIDGWSEVFMLSTPKFLLHGRFGNHVVSKTWANLTKHALLEVSFRFWAIDDWTGQEAIFRVDGYEGWRHAHTRNETCGTFAAYNLSLSNPWRGDRSEDKCYKDVTLVVAHNVSSVTMSFGTTIAKDSQAQERSWAFSHFRLRLGDESWPVRSGPDDEKKTAV
eukprot:TRINITY_DN21160_c0_g1_i1.p1 TRINITY_DN21160_c0_g1~~TRINITY_DN21160_c0_g1_i1.p1  ORF type:complete len:985 (-),score=158.72 TRINITY_DN21160_c0_g1_i1:176-3130(-)